MTGTATLLARSAIGIAGAVAGFAAVLIPSLRAGSERAFDRRILTWFGVSRLGLYAITFLVLHIGPRGDIPAYYVPEALSALHGMIPYRDFGSSYAPLHPYLDAAVLAVWHSPLALILAAICAEAVLLWTWLRLGRLLLDEDRLRLAALLYLTSPISLQYVSVDGQDNVLIALALAASLWLMLRNRQAGSGAALGASIACVKFLPLIFVPAFLMAVRRPVRWLAGLAAVVIPVYGLFMLRHAPVLYPLHAEGSMKGAGNLPYLLESLSGRVLPAAVEDGAVAISLLVLYALMLRPVRRAPTEAHLRIVAWATAALTLAVLLLAKKSWPPYLMFALFPLCLAIVRPGWTRLRLTLWCGFSAVAVIEHSYWASIMDQVESIDFHRLLLARSPGAFVLLALELLLLAGYGWLLATSMRQIQDADTTHSHPEKL